MTIPPVPSGIADPNDLCNGVYNEDQELANLAWSNPRLHAALDYILRQSGATVDSWASIVNPGANTAPALRTSTFARIVNANGTYHDADVRNIYRTPISVVVALHELAKPGVPVPQLQPFVYEAAVAGPSPIGAELIPSPWLGRRLWRTVAAPQAYAEGARYDAQDGIYQLRRIVMKPGWFGQGQEILMAWEQVYAR